MLSRILKSAILLLLGSSLHAQQDYPVLWDYKGQSFEEFVIKAESVYPLRFFYEYEWVKDIVLEENNGIRMLGEILDTVCSVRDLHYYYSGNGNIILTREYEVRILKDKVKEGGTYLPGFNNLSNIRGSSSEGNIVVDIGDPSEKGKSGSVRLSGYVTDRDTKEPVAGVTVYFPGLSSGAVTNEHGYYSLEVPRGSHTVKFSFIGMKERIMDLNLYSPGELNIEMTGVLIPLKEAVITAEKDIVLQRSQAGVEKINIASMKLMPSSMGESDVTKNLLMIPGVSSVGEGSSGFNVRGGYADQNLILLYGAPLYNSSHFFGFFSAINSDIIRDVTLYKGGIPAKYGGRLSSVMDIVPADGDRRKFNGNTGISPVAAHF
ncbi:MAG: carboxypeptidase-like regulatory domain-containing protein, partial [Bacteroidales bacterium]|nr:carboxypeptidase-like regulatory domain-containing protein [Bacteroidales bacterium]